MPAKAGIQKKVQPFYNKSGLTSKLGYSIVTMRDRIPRLQAGTVCFCMAAMLTTARLAFGGEPQRVFNATEARSAMIEFMQQSGLSLDQYQIVIEQPGYLKKTYLARLREKEYNPLPPPDYVILADGSVAPKSLERVVIAYHREEVKVSPDHDMAAIAVSIIRLCDLYGTNLISSLRDIPGYKKNPLNEDLEAVVRPPRQFMAKEGDSYWICFTYSQNQGWVKRYKFRFRDDEIWNPVDVLLLGERIGDYSLPE